MNYLKLWIILCLIVLSNACSHGNDNKNEELKLYLELVNESIRGHTYSHIYRQGLNKKYNNTLSLFEELRENLEVNNLEGASNHLIKFHQYEKWKNEFKLSDWNLDSLQSKISRLEEQEENSILKASYLLDAYIFLITNTVTVCGFPQTEIKFIMSDTLELQADKIHKIPFVILEDGKSLTNCQYLNEPIITIKTPPYSKEIIFTDVETKVKNPLIGRITILRKKVPIRLIE